MGFANILSLGLIVTVLYMASDVLTLDCPENYPFPSCPRPNVTTDTDKDTMCCETEEAGFHCCQPSCPEPFPFPSCPRPDVMDDDDSDTVCCYTENQGYYCCTEYLGFSDWVKVIIIAAASVAGIILCCCICCVCRYCSCIHVGTCCRNRYSRI
ncbi:uncharacterized protein LOC144343788 [Saccoglossus kowalevskii]